ncbi:baseplate J/gp47 family protein [Saccharibacter floricola]|uniref:Phage Mu protein n=1 Tax=Saccharibacter floricola DSM 15669 TaxID=1123227 RepID=A0ABQ0NZI2_9PROT|nr:baseplate J/gp47 family protein [Saccharibacter floricola]GBQ07250.1 phage Mu protein [Saccharibacter floricola DSM 15669]
MSLSDPTTAVPQPQLTETGFIAPSEQDILAGRVSDFNMALGGTANPALNTPQGQLALSDTAVLGAAFAALLSLFNGIDPASASGRMQEAIGRLYFMERRAATPTTVTVQATLNNPGQTIAAGTVVASDPNGLLYSTPSAVTLPQGAQTATLDLACTTAGAIPCPAQSLQLYQGGLGIASLTNPAPGSMGSEAENRTDFETRRRNSVAANSRSQNASLMGALLELDGVTDAYVMDNPSGNATTINGAPMEPHALYVLVEGGTETAIGQAILTKKPPGIATMGERLVTVQDTNPVYDGNRPSYTFRYDRPQPVPVSVAVTLEQSDSVPSDVVAQVQAAIMGVLTAGRYRARMGGTLYASRLSAVVDALGDWAEVLSLTLSTANTSGQTRLKLPINQLPTVTPATITVELV